MTGRRLKGVLATVAVTFILAGCAPAEYVSPISTGTVARKDFFPSHLEDRKKCYPAKVMYCKTYQVTVPDAWQFVIYDAVNPSIQGKVPVTEESYNSYAMGDLYPSVRTAVPTPVPTALP